MTPGPSADAGAATLVAALQARLPLRLGTLRVWGDWFGRPMDNVHTAVGARAEGDIVVIDFDQGETLTVEGPGGWNLAPDAPDRRLWIETASKVTWEWFVYGQPRTEEHRQRREHRLEGARVRVTSTVDQRGPASEPDPNLPAVEFLAGEFL